MAEEEIKARELEAASRESSPMEDAATTEQEESTPTAPAPMSATAAAEGKTEPASSDVSMNQMHTPVAPPPIESASAPSSQKRKRSAKSEEAQSAAITEQLTADEQLARKCQAEDRFVTRATRTRRANLPELLRDSFQLDEFQMLLFPLTDSYGQLNKHSQATKCVKRFALSDKSLVTGFCPCSCAPQAITPSRIATRT